MPGDLLNHREAALSCFTVAAGGFILFSILISCIPREMNDLSFPTLDFSADNAEASFWGGLGGAQSKMKI